MAELEVERIDDDNYIAVWGTVVLELCRNVQTTDAVRAAHRRIRGLLTANPPHTVAFVIITEPTAKSPSSEVREEIARSQKGNAGQLLGVALVIEGTGFQAAIMRSALAAFSMVGNAGVVDKVFATTDDGSLWLTKRPGWPPAATLPALRAAIADLRTQVGARG